MSEQAKALVAKWESMANSGSPCATDYSAGARWAYAVAAAELKAALSAPAQKNPDSTPSVGEAVSHDAATEALDSLDDYARMYTGIDAKGPRELLERYIEQQRTTPPAPSAAESEQSIKADSYDMIAEAVEKSGVRVSSIVDYVTGLLTPTEDKGGAWPDDYSPQLNLRGVLHEALTFVLDHADKDEDPEQWTLTKGLRAALAAAAPPALTQPVEVRDPHHGGSCLWKWDGGKLYHRVEGHSKWVQCKKVGATPARITAIYKALTQPVPTQPVEYSPSSIMAHFADEIEETHPKVARAIREGHGLTQPAPSNMNDALGHAERGGEK